jgi:hypothetical protein
LLEGAGEVCADADGRAIVPIKALAAGLLALVVVKVVSCEIAWFRVLVPFVIKPMGGGGGGGAMGRSGVERRWTCRAVRVGAAVSQSIMMSPFF